MGCIDTFHCCWCDSSHWCAAHCLCVLSTYNPHKRNGSPFRAAHHISFCVRKVHRNVLLPFLEEHDVRVRYVQTIIREQCGVIASGGSACSTGSVLPSHVLASIVQVYCVVFNRLSLVFVWIISSHFRRVTDGCCYPWEHSIDLQSYQHHPRDTRSCHTSFVDHAQRNNHHKEP